MQKKTMIIVGVLVAGVAGAIIGMNEYNREPKKALEQKEAVSTTAPELLAAFVADEAAANTKFVGSVEQAIRVTGIIRAISEDNNGLVNVTLETGDAMAGVVCEFAAADVPATWKPGDKVVLKGICTGYLIDVILNRCGAVE